MSGGKANAAVCELVSRQFDIPKSRVEVVSAHTSRVKLSCPHARQKGGGQGNNVDVKF